MKTFNYAHQKDGMLLNPLPDDKILDWSTLKQSVDDNFRFDETGRKHCG